MKAATQNTAGKISVSTTLSAECAASAGRTAKIRNGVTASASAAPIGCEKTIPRSDKPVAITSGTPLRARRS